jgi:hypothetical protein
VAREAVDELCGEDCSKVAQCQTHQRRGHLIRGIAASERFIYEIMLLCLVITLTSLDEVRKIRRYSTHKRKAADPLSAFTKAPELPTAIPVQRIA